MGEENEVSRRAALSVAGGLAATAAVATAIGSADVRAWAAPAVRQVIGVPAAAASTNASVTITLISPTPFEASSDPNQGNSMLIQITNTGGVALDNYLLAVQYGGPVYGMGVMPSETTLEIAGTTYPLSNPTFVDRSVFESRLYENTAGLAEDGVDFVAVRITGFIEGGGYSENCTLSVLLGDPYAEFPNFEFIGTSPQFVMKFVP